MRVHERVHEGEGLFAFLQDRAVQGAVETTFRLRMLGEIDLAYNCRAQTDL